MQSLRRYRVVTAVALVFALGVGITLGVTIKNWPILELDASIDLAEVLGFIISLITLALAWHIAGTIDRQKKKEEYKTEFILLKLNNIWDAIESTILFIEENDCQVSVINSKLKFITMLYLDLKNVCEMCGSSIEALPDRRIHELLKQIRRLSTESNRYELGSNKILFQSERDLTIHESVIHYHDTRIDDIKTEFNRLYNSLFKYCLNLE